MSTHTHKDYFPTIINSRPLLSRLASELNQLKHEFQSAWPEFRRHPAQVTLSLTQSILQRGMKLLFAPNVIAALSTVLFIVGIVILVQHLVIPPVTASKPDDLTQPSDMTFINLKQLEKKSDEGSIGRNGNARVGFRQGSGEGSGEVRRRSQGGGSGGNNEPLPQQVGKLPPPSNVLAAIPKTPPLNPATLPVAGMDIDPALWKDMKAPVFGDPRSNSTASSNGPGEGGGMGTNKGLGVGEGEGPGFGPGRYGNTGNGDKSIGCCGESGASGNNVSWDQRIRTGGEVEQRAKLLAKPEPQYTEEARLKQVTGTVTLRVVFSSSGQVEQIRAVQTLPFGLTERAIAAARQIRFVPAKIGGRAVSVYMQLEYNFNLY